MKVCKQVLKEINIYGVEISKIAKSHLNVCESCLEAYKKEEDLEKLFLLAKEIETPQDLKHSILESVYNYQQKRSPIPYFGFLLRATGVIIILIAGFWFGLQTANEGNNKIPIDFNITKTEPYRLNMEPIYPKSLTEIYFTALEERKDEKQ